jgi:hypothetical protein
VIRRRLPILIAGFCLVLWAHPVRSSAEDACEALRERWVAASQRLKESMESYRRVKEASLASRIQQELSDHKNALSVARSVQIALKERSVGLDQQGRTCQEVARGENEAFEQWRRCAARGNPRRGAFAPSGLDAASGERKRLLASLQDLLLDEAYAQYRNYHPPTSPSYSGNDQQQWGAGQNQNTGYRPYQGYGGYR